VLIAPTVKSYLKQLFVALVRSGIIQLRMAQLLSASGSVSQEAASPDNRNLIATLSQVDLSLDYVTENSDARASASTPSSVQQNVPAWLIFAMFFVIIPISTAFIVEKQQGTFVRLRLMNLSALHLMLAKLAPYYIVNLIQMAAMIAVGMVVVPLLGGDRLNWPSSAVGLVIITSAASFAAIGFALLIATLAKTTVQATTLGGVFNIIFGALGGIMVPKFIMPPTMQDISVVSPMSWGLEGFLDVFLRNQPWQAVLPESLALLGFGVVCLAGATAFFKRLV
jgi:ABC-2 type transport system permease protein